VSVSLESHSKHERREGFVRIRLQDLQSDARELHGDQAQLGRHLSGRDLSESGLDRQRLHVRHAAHHAVEAVQSRKLLPDASVARTQASAASICPGLSTRCIYCTAATYPLV
jgi:hypothetical protein